MKKKIISTLLCMVMIAGCLYNPMSAPKVEAATTEPTEQVTVQTKIIAGESPTGEEGQVFAGWYKDADFSDPVKSQDDVPENGAYAKFVDANVLTVKCQTKIDKDTQGNSIKGALRVVTSLDSLDFRQGGFVVQIGENENTYTTRTVYETIKGYVNDDCVNYTPGDTFVNGVSQYFMIKSLSNIPATGFDTPITVTPFWTTPDGTDVQGTPRTVTMNQGIPVELNAYIQKNKTDEITIVTSENVPVEVILNGNEKNASAVTVGNADAQGRLYGTFYIKSVINDMPIGDNVFTIRAKKDNLVSEVTVTYKNTGFLYSNDSQGTLAMITDDATGEQILKFTTTGKSNGGNLWSGVGSNYIATYKSSDGTYQLGGSFAADGVKYMTAKVKLVQGTGIRVRLMGPNNEVSNSEVTVNTTNALVDNNGIIGKLSSNTWVTLKIPLNTANNADGQWRIFYIEPLGTNPELLIKDVKYIKEEYTAPISAFMAQQENNDLIIGSSDAMDSVYVIVNGDESNKVSVTLDPMTDAWWTNQGYNYMTWNGVMKNAILNQLNIGSNEITVRATKGTLVVEKTLTYTNNSSFMFVMNAAGSLETVTLEGESVLKFTDGGTNWEGLGNSLIANSDDQPGKWYATTTYVTMKVKMESGTKLRVNEAGSDNTGTGVQTIDIGSKSQYLDNNGVQDTLALDKWVTVKFPITGTAGSWAQFYIEIVGGGVMYVKDVNYMTDTYVAPVEPATTYVAKKKSVTFSEPDISQYTTYYFDSESGDDSNAGTDIDAPKKTMTALNSLIADVQADTPVQIRIKAGSKYTDTMQVNGFVADDATPLIINTYGKTVLNQYAMIEVGRDVSGNEQTGVIISGDNLHISGLEITGPEARCGIYVHTSNQGAMKNVVISDNYVHDINFRLSNVTGGWKALPKDEAPSLETVQKLCSDSTFYRDRGGILLDTESSTASWFENIWIMDNVIERVSRTGIKVFSSWMRNPGYEWGNNKVVLDENDEAIYAPVDIEKGLGFFPHKNVNIVGNEVLYAGGDAIIAAAISGGFVENNISYHAQYLGRGGSEQLQYNAGIWIHSCNNMVMQNNEAAYTHLQNDAGDGQGFDIDIANHDILFQNNYSHHNEGGGLLLCNVQATDEVFNETGLSLGEINMTGKLQNITVRNNVFADNVKEDIDINGIVKDLFVENNTFIIPGNSDERMILTSTKHNQTAGDKGSNWNFMNNIFVSREGKKADFDMDVTDSYLIDTNVFWGFPENYVDEMSATHTTNIVNMVVVDPIITPSAVYDGMEAMYSYKPGNGNILTGAFILNEMNQFDAEGVDVGGKYYFGAFSSLSEK